MKLVIAEKPSVAKSIAKVIGAYKSEKGYMEGSGCLVSWCIGHLVGLVPPDSYDEKYGKWRLEDLPIIPEKWMYEVSRDKTEQFATLKKLMHREDVDCVVNACDAGREGELIFRLVYQEAECRKPMKRLWINSMEDEAIRQGFEQLRDGSDYDRLYDAAACRSKADWLVGMNATRLFTSLYHHRLTVGRVQTPTLALIVDRNNRIRNFEKQKYFTVDLQLGELTLSSERIDDPEEAEQVRRDCDGKTARITEVESTKRSVNPPKLFDLTALQREANRIYGYTAAETLSFTQSLYEKKLVTYPRTDSRFLTEDMADTALAMTDLAAEKFNYSMPDAGERNISSVLDSSKVSDHTAIIPTAMLSETDVKSLSKAEQDILALIVMQLLCATGRKEVLLETEIRAECAGHLFSTKGKTVQDSGWKAYENQFKGRLRSSRKEETEDEKELPRAAKGQTFPDAVAKTAEHFTSPPKAFTEDTLLAAMETAGTDLVDPDAERKGLGTPATRASMIEKLVASGYMKRKNKQLLPTEDGIALIEIMPEEIRSPQMTAEWENHLKEIERGERDAGAFMDEISSMVTDLVRSHQSIPEEEQARFGNADGKREVIGTCPRCGSPVYEGRKNYYCSNRACAFLLWKESRWLEALHAKVTKKMAREFLKTGRARNITLYSEKKGRNFVADLVMEDAGKYINFRMEFPKREEKKNRE